MPQKVFEPEYLGRSRIFDGKKGNPFEQPVLIGKSYILKLIHQVDNKIHAHPSGYYTLVTQQPLRGRQKQGEQWYWRNQMEFKMRLGTPFASAKFAATITTAERKFARSLCQSFQRSEGYKFGHIRARQKIFEITIVGGTILNLEDTPESFQLLVRKLQPLSFENYNL
ncbi:hypothetical protein M9H77_10676 [Catharanthus roseus]|uniref:Uncharacterized protein n=1 Tax=Catharanthus roseus TaxID=4058 RepID=A0ACC0BCG0_CATRO|nr:hypothetical protein M9H77_10676 [Catharanthus roseus]